MPRILSKSKILAGHQCPKRLYLEVHRPELARFSEDNEARFRTGHAVGEIARQQFPGGILIEHGDDPGQALVETRRWIRQEGDLTLFEPAFQVGGVYMRADILRRQGGIWELIEVKSSTSVKPYHLIDLATQTWVLESLDMCPDKVCLAHIDKQFSYPGNGDYAGLFSYEYLTEEVISLTKLVPDWVKVHQDTLAGLEPRICMGSQCHTPFECPFLDHCDPPDLRPEYPVSVLPKRGTINAWLQAEGYRDLLDVPPKALQHPLHQRIYQTTLTDKPYLSPGAAKTLGKLSWPRYYLDFETIQFAAPIWVGTHPYQQLPFQWSCHIEQAYGLVDHLEFLDISGSSPLRVFAESLIAAIPDDGGAILGYNVSFEKGVMNSLAIIFPDLADPLTKLASRCTDLLTIAREHYYHRDMKGSWSIKAVLPTVAPDLDYANLDVQHGTMAQDAYLEAIHPDTLPARKAVLRRGLLAYCQRDTLALVRLAAFFNGSDPGIGTP